MNHRITRRSFVKTTGVAVGLAPFASLMRANTGYPDAGADLKGVNDVRSVLLTRGDRQRVTIKIKLL
ncbi:twin-arginine translocation signal domain-containing protein [Opitutia bacterium ISCC 51]|nr:twin-arginine translocation signal domain-containing protein [Opitutae bacterium ISCC 51]QXD27253.1 twin-arginine translocation signal domain-containing protein [Opitutae bacterium ISCC 52]